MRNLLKALTVISVITLLTAMIPSKVTKVLFFGDSITEMGVKPRGYISQAKEILAKNNLSDKFQLIGQGVSGNKIYDLFFRMDQDVIAQHPDIVIIYIGVNDVWHKSSMGTGTDPDKFENFYVAVIKKLQANNIKVILATPAVIGERTDNSNQQDGDLNFYAAIIRRIAVNNNCDLIDLRKLFIDYNLKNNPANKESGILTIDRVHLNDAGNKLVADAMVTAFIKVAKNLNP